MGYSISVEAKDREQANEILNVASILFEKMEYVDYKYLGIGDQISYPPNVENLELCVGVSASTMNIESWSIMAYISKKFNLQDNLGNNVFYYDDEKFILKDKLFYGQEKDDEDELWFFINEDGSPWHPERKKTLMNKVFIQEEQRRQNEIIKVIKDFDQKYDYSSANTPRI